MALRSPNERTNELTDIGHLYDALPAGHLVSRRGKQSGTLGGWVVGGTNAYEQSTRTVGRWRREGPV